jgi:hypothetical protein
VRPALIPGVESGRIKDKVFDFPLSGLGFVVYGHEPRIFVIPAQAGIQNPLE